MKVYTPKEVADLLQVSSRTIDRLIKAGKLAASKVASKTRITEMQLTQYLEDSRIKPEQTPKRSEPAPRRRKTYLLDRV